MLTLAYCFMIVFSSCFARDGDMLWASINSNGVKGFMYAHQHDSKMIRIRVYFEEPANGSAIEIYEHPTIENKCIKLGRKIYQFASENDKVTFNGAYVTSSITIRGKKSIQGRSLVISNSSGDKLACATILSRGGRNKYAAATVSTNMIAGKIEFIQQGTGETVITGQISRSDGTIVPTSNHSVYITSDYTSEMTPKCPKTLNLDNIYNPSDKTGNCDENAPNTCKVGDLVGKHGLISVGITGNKRFTMVDSNLPLKGRSSVLKRLVVITSHLDPKKVIGCGIIMQKGPLQANADFKAVSSQGISGRVAFTQDSPYHYTKVSVNLRGLSSRIVGSFHVHNLPISDASNPCGKDSVGGNWNPYNVDAKNLPPTKRGTLDEYESGDLSRKFGDLSNRRSYYDNNLPMFGRDTLIERSIVINSTDRSGSRLVCANIVPEFYMKLQGRLDFTLQDDTLNGSIYLTQYQLQTNIMTPTFVVVSLGYKGNPNKTTVDHKFHVHINPISDDKQHGGKCKSCLGHYNPAPVNMTNYNQQCNKEFPLRCELGDLSSKLGTYDIGTGKKLYTAEDISLYGEHTVLGRSIVFNAENASTSPIACADIKPVQFLYKYVNIDTFFVMEGKSSVKDNDRMNTMIDIIAKSFGWQQKKWKIAYPRLEDDEECYKFSFYLLDEYPTRYSSTIRWLAKRRTSTFFPC